jgi:arylsulfatase A-like enzyme/Tfp pilus assembly protein PilF
MRRLAALVFLALLPFAACRAPASAWNLLVVTFDTTRADFLGCYGKTAARTPNVDRLAAEGFQFMKCYTAVPITLPSHSTIFTGTYPLAHGVRDNGLFTLPRERATLATRLKARGYSTGAAIGGFPLTREYGIDQGFDFFDDHITVGMEDFRGRRKERDPAMIFDERPAGRVNDAILPWLRENVRKPFFAWIHYWDPHEPHVPPPPFDQLYAHDLYQGEIAYADQSLGTVLDELRRLGALERTVVVMLGDHGEGRDEHNELTHSLLAYDSTLHVPLIVRVPGLKGGRKIRQRVGTVDVTPTLLDLLGLRVPEEAQGRSLARLLRDDREEPAPPSGQVYYAETLSPRLSFGWGELRVLFEGPHKYIFGPRPELYDVDVDPKETTNLVGTAPGEAARLEERLGAFLSRSARPGAAEAVHALDAEAAQRLAALGYISGAGDSPASVREELRRDGTPPQDRARDVSLQSRVRGLLERGDALGAREGALKLVGAAPESAHYRGLLAQAYLRLGQIDKAAAVVEQARTLTARDMGVFLEVARQIFSRGNPAEGLAMAKRLISMQESAPGFYLLGEMYAQMEDEKACLAALEKAVALDPRHGAAQLSLAIHLAQGERPEEAEKHFVALLEHHPFDARGRLNYGVFLLQAARFEEGKRQLARVVELSPTYWQAHMALLAAHVDLHERPQALKVYGLLKERCPDSEILERARQAMESL